MRSAGVALEDDVYGEVVMYTARMRRTQIYIDAPLDDLLTARAAREHRSKASLIREAVAVYYGSDEVQEGAADPMDAWIGATADGVSGDIDEVVYGSPGEGR